MTSTSVFPAHLFLAAKQWQMLAYF